MCIIFSGLLDSDEFMEINVVLGVPRHCIASISLMYMYDNFGNSLSHQGQEDNIVKLIERTITPGPR